MFLVTTANQKYWKTDEKILFLGEWCKVYSEKHIWSNLDHENLLGNWEKCQQLGSHRAYLEEIYENHLNILASNLNNCHNEDRSIRYWRIITGRWLRMFIELVYDRYLSIKSAIDSNKVTSTWIPNLNPEPWVPVNPYTFRLLSTRDNFNLYLYGRIIKKLGKIPFRLKEDASFSNSLDLSGTTPLTCSVNAKTINRNFARAILKKSPDRFYKIILCSSGLSFWNNLKLVSSLGQFPFVSPVISQCKTPIKKNIRNNIKVPDETNEFESILNNLLAEQLPKSFLEDYLAILDKSTEAYPKGTKVILTANKMSMCPDDGFRFWVASQVEKGAKLVLAQHGGGYGLVSLFTEKHELKICDKFFTWGWGAEQPKTLPMTSSILQSLGYNIGSGSNGTILWVTTVTKRFVTRFDHIVSGDHGRSFLLQNKSFLNVLCSGARKLLLMRPYYLDWGLEEGKELKNLYSFLKISRKDSIIKQLKRSRLCVHGYFGTSWLETLSMNFPTVVFWDSNRVHTLTSVQSCLDDLRRVKILHDTPESAAEFINEIYEDPLLWWMSSELQQVKDKFCHLFARTSKNWLKEWKEELLRLAED